MSTANIVSSPCPHHYYAGCPICHPQTSVTYTPQHTTGGMVCLLCGTWFAHGAQHSCPKASVTATFTSAPMGWECPRCHAIHAPSVASCWCPAPSFFATGTGPDAPSTQPNPATPAKASLENSPTPANLTSHDTAEEP